MYGANAAFQLFGQAVRIPAAWPADALQSPQYASQTLALACPPFSVRALRTRLFLGHRAGPVLTGMESPSIVGCSVTCRSLLRPTNGDRVEIRLTDLLPFVSRSCPDRCRHRTSPDVGSQQRPTVGSGRVYLFAMLASPPHGSHERIPITALRRLYDLLRVTSSDFHLATAKELNRKPSALLKMIETSHRHFSSYENVNADFHGRGSSGTPTPECLASTKETHRLVAALWSDPLNVSVPDEFSFDYVDYEVCPNRTADCATFEDGRKARRGSPVDLLLRCRRTRLPIICEMKMATRRKRDQNTFFALIQGLMYAVELLTENQRRRLQDVYKEKLNLPTEGPYADLCLLLIGHDLTGITADLHQEANKLAGQVMASSSCLLRRLVCLNATLESREGKDFFTLAKLFPDDVPAE